MFKLFSNFGMCDSCIIISFDCSFHSRRVQSQRVRSQVIFVLYRFCNLGMYFIVVAFISLIMPALSKDVPSSSAVCAACVTPDYLEDLFF